MRPWAQPRAQGSDQQNHKENILFQKDKYGKDLIRSGDMIEILLDIARSR